MRKLLFWTAPLLAALLSACSGGGGGSDGGGITGNTDAGQDAGSTGAFAVQDLDLHGAGLGPNDYVAAALAPDGRIGVAYYWDVNSTSKRIGYLEVETDGSTRAISLTPADGGVSRASQLGITFDDGGNAHVAYFGNDPELVEPIETVGGDGGQFWFESDLAVATITPQGALSTEYPATNGFDYTACGNPVSDRDSPVVGYSPAIAVQGDQIVVVHRNLHGGQFPVQDYARSDFDATVGTPGNWSSTAAICGSDTGAGLVDQGFGQASSVAVLGDTLLAVTGGQTDIDGTVKNLFAVTYSNGAWGAAHALFANTNPPLAPNDGAGPRVAADPTAGFGLTWSNLTNSILYYASSADGQTWSSHENVFGAGTGGWYPSLAFDPISHQPVVAYYVCSQEPGVNAGSCPAPEDELRVSRRRTDGTWAPITVDPEGGAYPTLLFNGGQMVVVYRASSGGLRIARQVAP